MMKRPTLPPGRVTKAGFTLCLLGTMAGAPIT